MPPTVTVTGIVEGFADRAARLAEALSEVEGSARATQLPKKARRALLGWTAEAAVPTWADPWATVRSPKPKRYFFVH